MKKTLLQLFLYLSVQKKIANYKLLYESWFRHFIKWSKICITSGIFMTNFELQLQDATKIISYFWIQLVRMKSSKKTCAQFLIMFLLLEILTYVTFFFLLELVLKLEILHNIRNRRHSFAQQLFPQMYTSVKGITWKIFWVRARTLMLTENPFRRLIAFHCYCNFNPLAILNDVWYLWNAWYFS